jgi:CRISPR/Cas system CSM-associated protein Csm3 (group 7 of RAMP superfamily)
MPDADQSAVLKRPFDFVPLPYGDSVDRHPPTGHDVFDGNSGRLECELEALSPFLVMDSHNRAGPSKSETGMFMTGRDGSPLIPGTSLKGLIRSTFEVLLPCCVSMEGSQTGGMVEAPFNSCSDWDALCPSCRTFGFMSRGSGGRVHRGHVNLGEAQVVGDAERMPAKQLVPMFGPNPGSSHYQESSPNRGRRAKGRKFYFHQESIQTATTQNEQNRGPHVAPLKPGVTFKFTVTFENLSDIELAALVAALELTDTAEVGGDTVRVYHKLGYGKPAGLGSVDVQIRRAELEPPAEERYGQFDVAPRVLEPSGDALRSWVDEKKERFFASPDEPVQALCEILRYPPPEDVTYTYYPNGREY